MGIFLIPVVFLEAFVAFRRKLGNFWRLFRLFLVANLISLVIGYPLVAVTQIALQSATAAAGYSFTVDISAQDAEKQARDATRTFLKATLWSYYYEPVAIPGIYPILEGESGSEYTGIHEPSWYRSLTFGITFFLCFLASWQVEYQVIRRRLEIETKRINRAVLLANVFSYLLLILFFVVPPLL